MRALPYGQEGIYNRWSQGAKPQVIHADGLYVGTPGEHTVDQGLPSVPEAGAYCRGARLPVPFCFWG